MSFKYANLDYLDFSNISVNISYDLLITRHSFPREVITLHLPKIMFFSQIGTYSMFRYILYVHFQFSQYIIFDPFYAPPNSQCNPHNK